MAKGIKGIENIDETSYFVSVSNPLELRKEVLESSKNAIYALQNYQKILLVRQKKLKEIEDLKTSVKELLYLNKKFNEKLPKYKLDILPDPKKITKEKQSALSPAPKKAKSVAAPVNAPVKVPKAPPKEKTELEKLEDSLASIEGKLKNMQ
jgi:hypothetical protein